MSIESSKINRYVAVNIGGGLDASKINRYVIVETSGKMRCSKLNRYVVIRNVVPLVTLSRDIRLQTLTRGIV